MMRMPWRRAAARISSCDRDVSVSRSGNPGDTITAVGTPAFATFLEDPVTVVAGPAMTARSGTASSSSSRRDRADTVDIAHRAVDDAGSPAERLDEVGDDAPPRCRVILLHAEHDHMRRIDDRPQRAHGGPPVALVGVVLEDVVGRQVELDVDHAVVQPAAVGEPDGAEHGLHRGVVGQRLGDETAKAGGLGDHRQVLQEDRGDALVVMGVGHGEGDLGFVACAAAAKYSPTPTRASPDSATRATCRPTSLIVDTLATRRRGSTIAGRRIEGSGRRDRAARKTSASARGPPAGSGGCASPGRSTTGRHARTERAARQSR